MGFEIGVVIFCVLAFLLLWQRTPDGGKSNDVDAHFDKEFRAWQEARRSGETDLGFQAWKLGRFSAMAEAARKKAEDAQEKVREQKLAAGGAEAETVLLWDMIWDLRRAQVTLKEEHHSQKQALRAGSYPELVRAHETLDADFKKRKRQIADKLRATEESLSAIQAKLDHEAFAERRARLDQEYPERPYRLRLQAPDPNAPVPGHGYRLVGTPDPYARTSPAAGQWIATSTKWGLRSTLSSDRGETLPLSACGLSQNSAIVNLFNVINQQKNKVALPLNPMDVDV